MQATYRIERVGRATTHYLKIGRNILYVNRAVGQSEAELRDICEAIVRVLALHNYSDNNTL